MDYYPPAATQQYVEPPPDSHVPPPLNKPSQHRHGRNASRRPSILPRRTALPRQRQTSLCGKLVLCNKKAYDLLNTCIPGIILLANKNTPRRKLNFFQIKISPTFWTLIKIKVVPFDSQTINESNGVTFIFMSVQRVGEILI